MRFALIQEGDYGPGSGIHQHYPEMIKEAQLAEKVGFETYCMSEQHFLKETCTVSAPEVFLTYLAAKTTKLRLRVTSSVMLSFNHPVRVAERLSTLDILSGGRAELGTARSNNLYTLEGFGVDPANTRAEFGESMDVLMASLCQESFSYKGKYWQLPERSLTPKAVQDPHPPILVSATSLVTHRNTGEQGLGVMTGNSILGWEYAKSCIDAYRDSIKSAKPRAGSYVNNFVSFFVAVANCSDSMEQARAEVSEVARRFIDFVIWLYSRLGETSPEYAYLKNIREIEKRKDDLDFVLDSAPYFMVGSPDYLVERFRRLEEMGVDEVMLRIEGMGHENDMRAIEAFGEHVIPKLKGRR